MTVASLAYAFHRDWALVPLKGGRTTSIQTSRESEGDER